MGRNGYNPSLFSTKDGICYICHKEGDTARHEVLYGIANRRLSKKYGLWIAVCPSCHNRIHAEQYKYLFLKETAQKLFESVHGHTKYMEIYGRNYLEEREWR